MARSGTGFRRLTQAAATLSVLLLPIGLLAQDLSVGDGAEVTKTAALERVILTGRVAGDEFGVAVASAGDVNGDGYADVIVGAHKAAEAGRAYLYFGGKPMDHFPDVVLEGRAAGDGFGFAVAGTGDVNGDGYGDVIVGAKLSDAAGADAGRAYVYFGGAKFDLEPKVVMTGESAGDLFGFSVAAAGDVNGDGFADVIVGASGSETATGRAYLYHGGGAMDSAADLVMNGQARGDWFGTSVAAAGDVNGDGYGDLIVGATDSETGGADPGRAYVFFGGATADAEADVVMTAEASGDGFGQSVASAGDVNGDGYADVVVGAWANAAKGRFTGRAYLYAGGAAMDHGADLTLTGANAGSGFGFSVASAGDVNGDGYADLLVGAFGDDALGPDAGRAYLYYGGAQLDAVVDMILNPEAAGDLFGYAVASAGDVNGDGYSDAIVGAYSNDTNGALAGRAYVYLNAVRGHDLPDEIFSGEEPGDWFGTSVASAGDVNGDGHPDMIVGAPGTFFVATYTGRAYVYLGGPGMDRTADVVLTGEAAEDVFGNTVASAGDVNGDGYADVVVGAFGNDAGGDFAGRAYIYFGGSQMNDAADVTLTGQAAGDRFGNSVASAGDVNGDGYADVVVGAHWNDAAGDRAGRAYIFFGGSQMNDAAEVTLTGRAALDQFGRSVASAGDVNGDGFDDVVVGALGAPDGGAAYVYFGGASMDAESDLTIVGAEGSTWALGGCVAYAGDVNSDGYADFTVGDFENDGLGTVRLFLGGSTPDNTADVLLTGEATDDELCNSASAGDVNGDGYDDVVVGTGGNDAGGEEAGRAYVFFGGAAMDNVADVIMTGREPLSGLGDSIASAGDINGDGYADILVGAPIVGADQGRAYLYLSSSPSVVPRITSVTDVPGDQGGFVSVKWTRSGYDARGINRVTQYNLYRSDPPGAGGLAWEHVATVPAAHLRSYDAAVPTRSNTTGTYDGATYFMVEADNLWHPDEYWRSAPEMGASIDNLAPAPPQGASIAAADPVGYRLSWEENTADPDVWGYVVYRSTDDGFAVGTDTRLATTSTAGYLDEAVSGDSTYYYRLTTRDIHGNESVPTAVLVGSVATGIDEASLPAAYRLRQNYPNPFNPETTIRYELPEAAAVHLEVFDALGRRVQVLADGRQPPGRYAVVFEAAGRPSGIYFYRLEAGPYRRTRSLILLR